jgi:CubicO group peptidase (beta-lactamase class C family)
MKQFIGLFLLLSVGTLFGQSVQQKLDEYLTAAQNADMFNGSVLIAQKGKVLLNKGYGLQNLEQKKPVDANTIYQIGSVTKQFTSTIILRLTEQGKLQLSDKIGKYFPSYTIGKDITIEQLLHHTSGIWNYTNDAAFMQTEVEKPMNEAKMFKLFEAKPLDFTPGSKYSYSNTGYMLLGYIIEKVTGKKYEQVVRQQIFTPLQMNHSGFDFTHLTSPNKATGYNSIAAGKGSKSIAVDSSVSFSAGAMYTITNDLYKWNQSLSTNKILNAASLKNAFTLRLSKYGLGWSIDTVNAKQIITHGGGIHGFLSGNMILPGDSTSITILSNSNTSKMDMLTKDILAILYNQPYKVPEANQEIKVDTAIMRRYTGEYQLAPGFTITIVLIDGALRAQVTGQPQFELYAKKENLFFLRVVDAQMEFLQNDQGEVDRMILHQGGRDHPGKKIR